MNTEQIIIGSSTLMTQPLLLLDRVCRLDAAFTPQMNCMFFSRNIVYDANCSWTDLLHNWLQSEIWQHFSAIIKFCSCWVLCGQQCGALYGCASFLWLLVRLIGDSVHCYQCKPYTKTSWPLPGTCDFITVLSSSLRWQVVYVHSG